MKLQGGSITCTCSSHKLPNTKCGRYKIGENIMDESQQIHKLMNRCGSVWNVRTEGMSSTYVRMSLVLSVETLHNKVLLESSRFESK